jgi:hypothetical protein
MERAARACTVAMALSVAPGFSWWSPIGADTPATLRLRIHGSGGVIELMLERSRIRLAAILEHAGLELEWRDCRIPAPGLAGCDGPPLADEAVVRLQAGAPTSSAHACGISQLPEHARAHYITVFVDCAHAGAQSTGVSDDVVLAYTMAHEIGHVLLGRNHSGDGLMQARPRPIDWQRAAHGGLTFTAGEAQRLRQALLERTSGD